MAFKKSFCCSFNLSDDDIISVSRQCLCCVLWSPPSLKTGMDFRGQVWKRVRKMAFFLSEIRSGFWEPGGTPLARISRSTPRRFSLMVRESKKQSRAKAKQMSNEKTVGEGWKEKTREVGLSSLLRLSSLPCPIVFSCDHLLYETRTKSHSKIRCEKGVNPFSNWTKILTNGRKWMGKPLFGSALVSVFSGWYELLGLISAALSGPVLFFR